MLSPTGTSLASAQHLLSHARYLAQRGHTVTLLAPHHYYIQFDDSGFKETETVDGVTVKHIYLPERWRGAERTHLFPLGYWTWKLVARAREEPFDLIHVMKPYYTSASAALFLHLISGKPMVLECDDLEGKSGWSRSLGDEPLLEFKVHLVNLYERILPLLADAVVATSRALEDLFITYGVDRQRLFYIPYSVQDYMTRKGNGSGIRAGLNVKGNPVAIYCGALHPHNYDCDLLIDAMEIVRERLPDARLLIVGDGGARPELERAAGERGLLNGSIIFTGWVPRDEIPDYIAAADLGVVPMRDTPATRARGLSKVLEYLCQAKPVVIPGIGQAADLTDRGKAAAFIAPGDARAMAGGIAELLSDPREARRRGEHGRKYVMERFSPSKATDEIMEVYRLVLGSGK